MDENKSLNYVLVLMANLNLIIILYISVFMAYSLSGYIRANSAHEFLLEIDKAPITAWKIPTISLCLYLVILLLMRMHNISNAGLIVKVALELGISFLAVIFWDLPIRVFCFLFLRIQ